MASDKDLEKQSAAIDRASIDSSLPNETRSPSAILSSVSSETIHSIPSSSLPASTDAEKQTGAPDTQSALTRVLSSVSRTSHITDPGPPPDGGLTAWLQSVGGHLVIFNTWGYIASFGVFQTYYATTLNQPPSSISWVGSVQIFLLFFIGTFSGRLTDAGFFRPVFGLGSIIQLLGVFMTSLCTQYWQLFLAQGICTGIGNGLLFCPTMALLPTYFTRNRSFAIGIAAAGTATGGMVFPAVIEQLLPKIGFGWTIRTLGLIILVLQTIAFLLLKPRLPPRTTGPIVEWTAFKEPPYVLFALGMFLSFWGLYPGFYYIGSFAREKIGLARADSIYLLMVMNGVGLVGRLAPAWFADRYTGPLNSLIPFGLLSGLIVYTWAGVSSKGGTYAWAACYGVAAAGIQTLFPATLSTLTSDVKKMGVRMGMVFTIISFACLTGSPIAGALVQAADGNYVGLQCYAGTILVLGAATLTCARISKTGLSLRVRM